MYGRLIATIFGIFLTASLAVTTPARADAIDGNWCSSDNRHMVINGPSIETPGGNRITGNYDRHGFSYRVPENEPQPGTTTTMDLVDDDTIHLRPGGGSADKMEIWKRCELTT